MARGNRKKPRKPQSGTGRISQKQSQANNRYRALTAPANRNLLTKPKRIKVGTSPTPVAPLGRREREGGRVAYAIPPSQNKRTPRETRETAPTCKPRPASNKSKGGGARAFVPWCDRETRKRRR